ncbi:EAL domain-containing protein [Noviherbaspirillum sp.]|jgi:diguanylate cyclase (GGDEF)-like protein/PAS domain S-box-containing protein|uniref:GGDEF domain-containing response regulator n=1 Tax=Noviherbaspirillum sp. TaxID=1926288 RepID=UPI0025F1167D|nr:EAL domain-containing protein [Noviherbaspirillum sp.]
MTDANMVPTAIGERHSSKILVVEDEAIVALDLQLQLEEMGYTVCGVADTGEDAVERAWKLRPNLILMDIVLKGAMDGIEAAEQISHGLQIPVIFLTAYSDAGTVARAAHTASYGYLTKPFRPQELRAVIEVALYKAELERQLRDSEQWFASTLRSVADGIVATDEQGKIQFMNPAAEDLLGWQMSEACGRDVGEVAHIENTQTGAVVESPARRALQEGKAVGIDFAATLVSRNGVRLPIDDSAAPVKDAEGNSLGAVMVFRSVQERLAAEQKLRQSEEHFRKVFDFAPVGMALVGLDNRFLQVNGAICHLLGYSDTDLVGADQARFSCHDDLSSERAVLDEILSGKSLSSQFEKRYRTRDDRVVWTLVSVSLLRQNEEPLCYLWQIHDLTERKDVEDRLARLAHYDPLTGLANRACLSEEIERQILFARRHQQCFAVVFLDLDHFKQINDSLGHEAGDELLQAIAHKLKDSIREIDTVARLGGDEFVMLLTEVRSAEDVLTVTDKVRAECAQPFHIAGHEMCISISLGVSLYPDDAQDARTLLRFADSALYHAKAEGRNNLQFYRPDLIARLQKRMMLEAGLRSALAHREFELHYQPIVSLADGTPLMAEALIRWNHPTLGLLTPETFISLAEEMGLSTAIGTWVIGEACRSAMAWPVHKGRGIAVSINVSPRQFKSGTLVQSVTDALQETGLDPKRVCIEITEQVLLDNNEMNHATIEELKTLGVKIAIDDFGVGYSSLSYISRLAPSEIKIDCSLVRDVAVNPSDAAIVRATIVMAHSLDMTVVTEGVETQVQQSFLQSEGCDMAQGYLYALPAPAAEFRDWLNRNRPQ